MTGFVARATANIKRHAGGSSFPVQGFAIKSCRSLPAVNESPSPWSSTTLTSGFISPCSIASASAVYMAIVSAFFFSGRLIVMRSTSAFNSVVIFPMSLSPDTAQFAMRQPQIVLDGCRREGVLGTSARDSRSGNRQSNGEYTGGLSYAWYLEISVLVLSPRSKPTTRQDTTESRSCWRFCVFMSFGDLLTLQYVTRSRRSLP